MNPLIYTLLFTALQYIGPFTLPTTPVPKAGEAMENASPKELNCYDSCQLQERSTLPQLRPSPITAPTNGYAPTTIASKEAVSPAVGIVPIELPAANQQGSANLSFPIKIPPGRNGLQPQLALAYSSEAGNGWLGLGWSLAPSSIEVDTRWGVPRYSEELESETYLLDGGQLTPVSHRAAWKPRQAGPKRFYPSVEGAFQKIIRHGNRPENYRWEVISKDGRRQFYGGLPGQSADQFEGVLQDDDGHIAQWMLLKTQDLDGNFVRYHYTVEENTEVAGSGIKGRQIYLSSITYTGHGNTEGPYRIELHRESADGYERKDVESDARYGFIRVTAALLHRIEVYFQAQLVRSYRMEYEEGPFFKTLLRRVAEWDRKGELFYAHEFEYYDEVRQEGEYLPLGPPQPWDCPSDGLEGDLVSSIDKSATVTGTSTSNSFSAGLSVTVGSVLGNPVAKTNTGGGNYNRMQASSEGLASLVDISGDGLPDKLFWSDGQLSFRPNNGQDGFGPKLPVLGFSNSFERTATVGNSAGVEGHPAGGYLGYTQTWATNTTSTYFVDLNGDALIDLANERKGYFCYINGEGLPEFTLQSELTPSPIFEGELGDVAPPPPSAEEIDSLVDQHPLHDLVRMWEAPFDGRVQIAGSVTLLNNDDPQALAYGYNDGVQVSIQKGGEVLWQEQLLPDGPTSAVPAANAVNDIEVERGDRIYFRLQSIDDGAYDQVAWDPLVFYNDRDTTYADPNNKPYYRYQASDDFVLPAEQAVTLPLAGTVEADGQFSKPVTSDDVRVQVVQLEDGNETLVYDTLLPWHQEVEALPIAFTRAVSAQEIWQFRVACETNVDWPAISWVPNLKYLSTEDGTPTTGLEFCPAVGFSMYNRLQRLAPIWQPSDSTTYSIRAQFELDTVNTPFPDTPYQVGFDITCSVKGKQRLYGRQTFRFEEGALTGINPFTVELPAGDSIYLAYHIDHDLIEEDPAFPAFLLGDAAVEIASATDTIVREASVHTRPPDEDLIFGPMYRQWGHFAYNGNRELADEPLREDRLNAEAYEVEEDAADIEFDPAAAPLIILSPEPKQQRWAGFDTLTYLRAGIMSSSRFGRDDISSLAEPPVNSAHKYTPNKISSSITRSGTGGIGPLSAGGTWCTTESEADFMDLNGDRYPDVVLQNKITFTDPLGGLTQTMAYELGNHQAKSFAVSGGAAGNPGNSNASNAGTSAGAGSTRRSTRTKSRSGRLSYNSKESAESASYAGSLSAGVNYDTDRAVHSWLDMNGDALPDKVYENGEVALNLGYRFAPPRNWGFGQVRAGESIDLSAGLGVNLFNGSFEIGLSSSLTLNASKEALQDVNGDGLPDYIVAAGFLQNNFDQAAQTISQAFAQGEVVSEQLIAGLILPQQAALVRLNTGNGFASEAVLWPGLNYLDQGASAAESANTAITGCIPIPFLGIRICINPGGALGRGMSRQKTQLTDINGDGYPDHLRSEDDGELQARLSTIGRTNLLKSVDRPLGGEMELDYQLLGNTVDLPYGKWVLSSASLQDGRPGDGADEMKYAFEYGNGYYARHERMFFGFDTVRVQQLDTEGSDSLYRTWVHTYFNRDFYRRGLLKASYLQDAAGNRYTETQYRYEPIDARSGAPLATADLRVDSLSVFPALKEERQLFYEGQASPVLSTSTQYEYDAFGNLTEIASLGDGSPEDIMTTRMAYHEQPEDHLLGLVKSMEVETQQGILRRSETEIDERGHYTQIRRYLEDGTAAVTDMTYNEYGQLASLLRPENYQGQRMSYQYTYDDAVHTYVTEVEDAYGYRSYNSYDYAFGRLLETVDINGQKMVYTLDDRGRPATFTGPYELRSGAPYTIAYEYHTAAEQAYAITQHYDPEHDQTIDVYSFVDGLMRTVQTKQPVSLFRSAGQADEQRMQVSGTTVYDAFGRVSAQYYPTTEPLQQAGTFSTASDDVAPTRYRYDPLDRLQSAVLPDGAATAISYGFGTTAKGYLAFQTTITDPLGNKRETYSDLRGHRRATAAYGPEGAIWTHFTYNPLSELQSTTNHFDQQTQYTYDHFGRLTDQQHPDIGHTSYEYDLAGNLRRKTTAVLRETLPDAAITYHYEFERLTGIDYPRNFQNKVQLHYGGPEAPHNRAGRVWLIEDGSGGTEHYFGPLGERVKTVRTVLTSQGNVRTFVSEERFDSWNRLQEMIYPDGETVEYAYNKSGLLQSVSSRKGDRAYTIVEQLGYDKFEDRVFCAYGNGTQMAYTYESARRRQQELRGSGPSQGNFLQQQYEYDPVGNILSLQNQGDPEGLGGNSQHNFAYDQLYRLNQAAGQWSGKEQSAEYSLELAYDDVFNILRKYQEHRIGEDQPPATNMDWEYWYEGEQPHAASEIGPRLLQYDANGNLLHWRDTAQQISWRFLWDEENRLAGVFNEGYFSQYTYDAGGERVIKSHGPSRGVFANGTPIGATGIDHYDNYTIYLSPFFTATELGFTKHYFVEGERVLTKQGSGQFANDFWNNPRLTAGDKNYVKRLQLMQQAYWQQIESLQRPPGEPSVPQEDFPIPGLDSLGNYDNEYPDGWPRPVMPDTSGPPGEPTLVDFAFADSIGPQAGYGFYGAGAPPELNQFFYHTNHLGSVHFITDAAGEVRQHLDYLPFGATLAEQSREKETSPYGFNGKEQDAETTLYYFGARYYDPAASLWLGADPLLAEYPQLSPFQYCGNNPVNVVDPDGRFMVFVNGFHAGNGGTPSYWGNFDSELMNAAGDQNAVYYDGAIGGAKNILKNRKAANRYRAGKAQGELLANAIAGGKVALGSHEPINIVSHSMGGAYAQGVAEVLARRFPGRTINDMRLAPFQPGQQAAVEGVRTIQMSKFNDYVAANRLLGSRYREIAGGVVNLSYRDTQDGDASHHRIRGFNQHIAALARFLSPSRPRSNAISGEQYRPPRHSAIYRRNAISGRGNKVMRGR